MSFFDAPPPPPPKRPPSPPRQDWMAAPEGWLGGFVPVRAVLARTAEIAITLGPMEAFPTGVSLELQITTRRPARGRGWDLDSGMQFGVAFADGRKWQGFRQACPLPGESPPPAPMMWPAGGGGDSRHFVHRYWLWPLPPPGPVTFALAWRQEGVEETTVQIEGAVFRAAAEQAQKLWEPLTDEEEEAAMRASHQRGWFSRSVSFVATTDESHDDQK